MTEAQIQQRDEQQYLEVDPDGEPLDIEVAAPVVDGAARDEDGPVQAGALPAGRYATLIHKGPYRHDDVPDLGDAQAASGAGPSSRASR